MQTLFEELRERLLVGGVAPRHIRRYLRELADHLADLRAAGVSEAASLDRLGDVEMLAAPMLARPEFRSWTARAPWATLVLGPIAALAAASAAFFALFAVIMISFKALHPNVTIEPMWLQYLTHGAIYVLILAGPLLIGWSVSVMAIDRALPPLWPLIGPSAVEQRAGASGRLHAAAQLRQALLIGGECERQPFIGVERVRHEFNQSGRAQDAAGDARRIRAP